MRSRSVNVGTYFNTVAEGLVTAVSAIGYWSLGGDGRIYPLSLDSGCVYCVPVTSAQELGGGNAKIRNIIAVD